MNIELDYRQRDITSIFLLSQRACDLANQILKPAVCFKPGDVCSWPFEFNTHYMHPLLKEPFAKAEFDGEVYC